MLSWVQVRSQHASVCQRKGMTLSNDEGGSMKSTSESFQKLRVARLVSSIWTLSRSEEHLKGRDGNLETSLEPAGGQVRSKPAQATRKESEEALNSV